MTNNFIKCSIALFLSWLIAGCTLPESDPLLRLQLTENSIFDADINTQHDVAIISVVGGAVEVWDLATSKKRYTFQHQSEGINLVEIVRFSPDASVAVTADSEAFALWDMQTGEPFGFWRIGEGENIRDIAVSNDGNAVLVGRANGQVMFFEPATERRLEFVAHQEKINSVDLSANGRFAVTGSNDYLAYLWDTTTGQVIHVFNHPHRVSKVVLDQQARYIFTADSQKQATIWDAQSGEKISRLQFIERQVIFTAAEFSQDGEYLLTGSPSRKLALWRVTTGEKIKQWQVKARPDSPIRSAVVYGVGFQSQRPISIASSGYLAAWE
ncbi:MAG: hypothetical protein AAGJ37_15555 [Pseudomonadota bacterium]